MIFYVLGGKISDLQHGLLDENRYSGQTEF